MDVNSNKKISYFSSIAYLTEKMEDYFKTLRENLIENLQEIKIRIGCDVLFKFNDNSIFAKELFNSQLIITEKDLTDIFEKMCNYSIHCKEKEIENGYISIKNGCRVGIGADFYTDNNGNIKGINKLYSLNIRISGFYEFDSKELCEKLFKNKLCGVLIAGAPSSGKTTLLRSIGFNLAKKRMNICFIDERKELVTDQENLANKNIDIIRGIKKDKAMEMALRVLSPQIIICDEIGNLLESQVILNSINGGVYTIASAHGKTLDEILRRPQIKILTKAKAFEKIVFLDENNIGNISEIVEI